MVQTEGERHFLISSSPPSQHCDFASVSYPPLCPAALGQ